MLLAAAVYTWIRFNRTAPKFERLDGATQQQFLKLGLPAAGLYGLLGFAMSGYVGLIGGFTLAALMIGWGALLTAALSGDKAVSPEV